MFKVTVQFETDWEGNGQNEIISAIWIDQR